MTVNEFAQDVHKNAVAHGWYDAPITFPEVAVMIHAEISEAVEEWRSGNPVIYGTCALSPENCKFSKICDNVGHPSGADTEGNCKPEGVAVELCDAVMRIMDFLAFMGVDIEAVLIPEDFGDDDAQHWRYLVEVGLFTPHDKNSLAYRREITRRLVAGGFTRPAITPASDANGQHYVFECEISGGVDDG